MTPEIKTSLLKKSFTIDGHRTSVALEPEFWSALSAMAGGRGITLAKLVALTDASRSGPLASSLRVAALKWAGVNHD